MVKPRIWPRFKWAQNLKNQKNEKPKYIVFLCHVVSIQVDKMVHAGVLAPQKKLYTNWFDELMIYSSLLLDHAASEYSYVLHGAPNFWLPVSEKACLIMWGSEVSRSI